MAGNISARRHFSESQIDAKYRERNKLSPLDERRAKLNVKITDLEEGHKESYNCFYYPYFMRHKRKFYDCK
ncbi:hypothetical protein HN604_03140 [archaeon]|jgi:hypothetical protein|nr:hypothetical protein [archaeon]MBT6183009.1 hypothetical protein [archaeon]MBT6606523.1 hypothetical protein [archaeon]MBT6955798.1 hypothetical protein [archaeon]MBT7251312.1 hypothetical protein [archaeon]